MKSTPERSTPREEENGMIKTGHEKGNRVTWFNPQPETSHRCPPQHVCVQVLQNHRDQQDLEGESWQVVIQEQRLLHHEEGQVVDGPATSTHYSCLKQLAPGGWTTKSNITWLLFTMPLCNVSTSCQRLHIVCPKGACTFWNVFNFPPPP